MRVLCEERNKFEITKNDTMNRLLFVMGLLVATIVTSCGPRENGELIGVQPRPPWYDVDPFGTVYIPMGAFVMGENDQDVPYAQVSRAKTVSVQAFYMDDTEITNNEYRQFVHWVRDSMAMQLIIDNEPEGWEEFAFLEDIFGNELDVKRWGNQGVPGPTDIKINWQAKYWIPYFESKNPEDEYFDVLEQMYYPPNERYYGKRHVDVRKLVYEYSWIDYQMAAKYGRMRHNFGEDYGYNRADFIKEDKIEVYPDTLCWVADFTYSYNEPLTQMYFWHPAYDDYPVVGVNWKQAKAFGYWRTNLFNKYLEGAGIPLVQDFRLPTETEWEYASRGGLDVSMYGWGGPYTRNDRGCLLANFKPLRGRYIDDGGFHTVTGYSYSPNDYGLYCMSGNVAEWTSNAYDESAYNFSHDLNPNYQFDASDNDHPALQRKVVRGGSWKDILYYTQTGVRSYEYQDTAKSYIGFRNVMTYLGRAKGDITEE